MQAPVKAVNDSTQIRATNPCDVADRLVHERFDDLTRLARRHFGFTGALITLVDADRHWLGSCDGVRISETTQNLAFCRHALLAEDMLVVCDTLADKRFCDHPLVVDEPYIRFFAACPLIASNGSKVGALCLFDGIGRDLDDGQREALREFARLAAVIAGRDHAVASSIGDYDVLRQRERRMALALAGSGTGIWDRNVPAGEIHYSTGWKAILGYTDPEITNLIEDSYRRVHPDDLAYVQATIQNHFDQKTDHYVVEHRIRCKDGSYKWISSRGKVVSRDSDGKPLRMTGTTTDITAMRAMSERLQQTVDLITSLTNEVPGLVFQYRRLQNGASFFSYASAGISDIYELTPGQVVASDAAVNAIVHPDDLLAYCASFDASEASLTPWHLEYRVQLPRQGLRWRQGDARPQRLEDGSTLWHGFITDVTERKRIDVELQEFASTDFLTQLPNRRHFMVQIEAELARLHRTQDRPAAVLVCDLDHFKSINDKWGHAVGDKALRHFAAILREQVRRSDIVGRVGGEEFAVVLRDSEIAEGRAFAQRLQQRVADMPMIEGDHRIVLTLSIGIATMAAADASADAALSRGDQALYRAKAGGRNRIECQ